MSLTNIARIGLLVLASALTACAHGRGATPIQGTTDIPQGPLNPAGFCRGIPGDPCCAPDDEVPTVHCGIHAGCNVAAGRCEECGAPGQPCCDGPLTGFSGRCYKNPLDPSACESCDPGAACDARLSQGQWVGSRRCFACGSTLGGSCCPIDPRYGVQRCAKDPATGHDMACTDMWGPGGVCELCGSEGQRPCLRAPSCDEGLTDRDDRCVPCGGKGLPSCEGRCKFALAPDRQGICVSCGGFGQPCCSRFGCFLPHLICFAGTCQPGGGEGEPCRYGFPCRVAADGWNLTCQNDRCQRIPHTRELCETCTFDEECKQKFDMTDPRCLSGRCYNMKGAYSFSGSCVIPKNPCAGVTCDLPYGCYNGKCEPCGYPGGECCNYLTGGCLDSRTTCSWGNKCNY